MIALFLSDAVQIEMGAERSGNAVEILDVTRDHEITPGDGAEGDGGVDDIGGMGKRTGSSGRAAPDLVEIFDPAALQQSRELGLRAAPPGLTEYAGRDHRAQRPFQCPAMQRPNDPVVSLCR